MIQERRAAAVLVADKLAAAEAAIDAAIAAVAALTAAMPTAAVSAQINMATTQEALMHAVESCSQLVKSRTNIIRTHKVIRSAQDEAGLGFMRFDTTGYAECPPSADQLPGLRIVAAA